jgi:hypothetical protein
VRAAKGYDLPTKTVFILGAGASRAAGGPLMSDFIECAIKIHSRNESGWAYTHFERIMKARRKLQRAFAKSSIDLDNIENLFSTFEMASLIGRLSDLDETEAAELPRSLRYLIMRTLEQSILFPINAQDQHIAAPYPYQAFAELLLALSRSKEAAPVSVINFNYDLCLDYALCFEGRPISYGLERGEQTRNALRVFKVHGSLNWFRDQTTGGVKAEPVQPLPMRTYWDRLGLNYPAERPVDCMEIIYGPQQWGEALCPDPVIVPPTLNKGWYQQQLKSVWRDASMALSTAENIFVIGYSLPLSDQFFRSFYSLSMISESIVDRFWLFDPTNRDDVVERFTSLLGPAITSRDKFKFSPVKFTGAIKTIAEAFGFRTVNLADR